MPLAYSATGLPSGLSIDPNTGVISGTLPADASENSPYTVTITADDGEATADQVFTWTIANPSPDSVDDAFAAGADDAAAVVGNALTNDSDPDGDTFSAVPASNIAGTNGGLFSIAANGAVTFDPNGDFDALGGGDTAATSFDYTIEDAQGGQSIGTVTVTVTGTNQPPEAVGSIPNQSNDDDDPVTLDVSGYFTDPDA